MFKVKVIRVFALLGVILAGLWIYAEVGDSKVESPRPGLALLAKMLEFKAPVEDALRNGRQVEVSMWRTRADKLGKEGMKLHVSADGVIDGQSGDIRIQLAPKLAGVRVTWDCFGTPQDKVPASCTSGTKSS